jgi:hypothetical protein
MSASREVPARAGLRLFLPESWTSDAARLDRACVPKAFRLKQPKGKKSPRPAAETKPASDQPGCH